MLADSALEVSTFSGTPWSRISSHRCSTRCVLMVLFPIPLPLGETSATLRINHCTAGCDFRTFYLVLDNCVIHWCHWSRDDTTSIQSVICFSLLLSNCTSGGASSLAFILFFRNICQNCNIWSANNLTNMQPAISCPIRFAPEEIALVKFILGRSLLLCRAWLPIVAHRISCCNFWLRTCKQCDKCF